MIEYGPSHEETSEGTQPTESQIEQQMQSEHETEVELALQRLDGFTIFSRNEYGQEIYDAVLEELFTILSWSEVQKKELLASNGLPEGLFFSTHNSGGSEKVQAYNTLTTIKQRNTPAYHTLLNILAKRLFNNNAPIVERESEQFQLFYSDTATALLNNSGIVTEAVNPTEPSVKTALDQNEIEYSLDSCRQRLSDLLILHKNKYGSELRTAILKELFSLMGMDAQHISDLLINNDLPQNLLALQKASGSSDELVALLTLDNVKRHGTYEYQLLLHLLSRRLARTNNDIIHTDEYAIFMTDAMMAAQNVPSEHYDRLQKSS